MDNNESSIGPFRLLPSGAEKKQEAKAYCCDQLILSLMNPYQRKKHSLRVGIERVAEKVFEIVGYSGMYRISSRISYCPFCGARFI